jgi:hypothetical protein
VGVPYGAKLNNKGKLKKDKENFGIAYNMFNEIVNDYIAIKVSKVLEEQGVEIGCDGYNYDATEYALGFKVLGDFIEKYFDELIECKMSNSTELIGKYFGFEN